MLLYIAADILGDFFVSLFVDSCSFVASAKEQIIIL